MQTNPQINTGTPSICKYSMCHVIVPLHHMFICQTWWEEKQNNKQSLTSSASQWCSSPTLRHLQREQQQAEVKNTLLLAEKCKQAASERASERGPSHIWTLVLLPSLYLPVLPSALQQITVLIFILDQHFLFSLSVQSVLPVAWIQMLIHRCFNLLSGDIPTFLCL